MMTPNPNVMDQFDKLLMRAAENRRKEIVDLHGHDMCDKLLARGGKYEDKHKVDDPELIKKQFEDTIYDLLQAYEKSPRSISRRYSKSPKSPKKALKIGSERNFKSPKSPKKAFTIGSPRGPSRKLSKNSEKTWRWDLVQTPIKEKKKRIKIPKVGRRARGLGLDLF